MMSILPSMIAIVLVIAHSVYAIWRPPTNGIASSPSSIAQSIVPQAEGTTLFGQLLSEIPQVTSLVLGKSDIITLPPNTDTVNIIIGPSTILTIPISITAETPGRTSTNSLTPAISIGPFLETPSMQAEMVSVTDSEEKTPAAFEMASSVRLNIPDDKSGDILISMTTSSPNLALSDTELTQSCRRCFTTAYATVDVVESATTFREGPSGLTTVSYVTLQTHSVMHPHIGTDGGTTVTAITQPTQTSQANQSGPSRGLSMTGKIIVGVLAPMTFMAVSCTFLCVLYRRRSQIRAHRAGEIEDALPGTAQNTETGGGQPELDGHNKAELYAIPESPEIDSHAISETDGQPKAIESSSVSCYELDNNYHGNELSVNYKATECRLPFSTKIKRPVKESRTSSSESLRVR